MAVLLSDEVSGGSMSGEVNIDGVKLIDELCLFGEGRNNTRLKKEKNKKKGRRIIRRRGTPELMGAPCSNSQAKAQALNKSVYGVVQLEVHSAREALLLWSKKQLRADLQHKLRQEESDVRKISAIVASSRDANSDLELVKQSLVHYYEQLLNREDGSIILDIHLSKQVTNEDNIGDTLTIDIAILMHLILCF
ncbi:hypothetical protein QJS10_CPB15g01589 [Acorus calamus]|uniref:Uncharacterized protein n=1 Tax=Acorus calamus TaxID=4465 RepID=A0AAV9D5M6_ACOCL|nr:hypothetical protein QJS10_CPB15g01589 [Acorus calamus]